MGLKLDHVGIVVADLANAVKLYSDVLQAEVEYVTTPEMKIAIVQTETGALELMEPVDSSSAAGKFLAKQGEGLHHLAVQVDDIKTYMEKVENDGRILIDKQPRQGNENKQIAFIHPKSCNGVLLELCMSSKGER